VLEILYHHADFGEARISPAAAVAKNVEFFCLSVCLSVTLLNARVCSPDFAMKTLEYRNDFDAVDIRPSLPPSLPHPPFPLSLAPWC